MHFDPALLPARLIRRYKRFLADIAFEDGTTATAHCPNPGSMMGLAEPGAKIWVTKSANPKRKLAWGWELVELVELDTLASPPETRRRFPGGGAAPVLVGIHTTRANALAREAVEAGRIKALTGYDRIRREVPYGEKSRIDLLLEDSRTGRCAWVEVKSVTLSRRAGTAEFPDAVTTRGARHLAELARLARQGKRAVMLYVIQRGDCTELRLADDIDPAYAKAAREAHHEGVEMLCYDCRVTPGGIALHAPASLIL